MNPIIPSPDAIPVHWAYFQFLLLLTFPLHLLFMNSMLGSAVIALVQNFRKGEQAQKLAHWIGVFLPLCVAFTVNFGVAPLLFLQVLYGQFSYVSTILMGTFWIGMVELLIVAYYGTYLYDFKFKALGKRAPWILLFSIMTFLLIGFMFSNNMTLMLEPETWSAYFDNRAGLFLNTDTPTLWPRYLHMITGALAVGGLFTALISLLKKKNDPELMQYGVGVGMQTFFRLSLIQIGVGIWYLTSLDHTTMMLFLGTDLLATVTFTSAMLVACLVLWAGWKQRPILSLIAVTILLYLMTFMRDMVRTESLAPY
ncbi:MAG: hypothetical protein PF495_20960, partial [Spirochaetales bacterium]|nr:hypothetical protein [Spirochaetales bacterium]